MHIADATSEVFSRFGYNDTKNVQTLHTRRIRRFDNFLKIYFHFHVEFELYAKPDAISCTYDR